MPTFQTRMPRSISGRVPPEMALRGYWNGTDRRRMEREEKRKRRNGKGPRRERSYKRATKLAMQRAIGRNGGVA